MPQLVHWYQTASPSAERSNPARFILSKTLCPTTAGPPASAEHVSECCMRQLALRGISSIVKYV